MVLGTLEINRDCTSFKAQVHLVNRSEVTWSGKERFSVRKLLGVNRVIGFY